MTTETQTEHTPGPWYVEHPYSVPGTFVSARPGVSLVCKVYDASCAEEREATARLIAQAPDTKRERDELREALGDTETAISRILESNSRENSVEWIKDTLSVLLQRSLTNLAILTALDSKAPTS